MKKQRAILMLESGVVFQGYSIGAEGERTGEVVFNTAMSGYQEILTDPSYKGQIVTLTYPHIGNYGVNPDDVESRSIFVEGFVVHEASSIASNWRSTDTIFNYLKKHNIPAIEGVDTRTLTKHIRQEGAMRGIISTIDFNTKSLIKKIKNSPKILGRDLVKEVTCEKPYEIGNGRFKIVVMDFGVKLNILRSLIERDCKLIILPANSCIDKILSYNPDGILLSNGPGDPEGVPYAIETVKDLIKTKIPIFGICLGHQILCLAFKVRTYKLNFGHHGANHPVKDLKTNKIEITSQNHCFCVEMKKLNNEWVFPGNDELRVTHINLYDQTCEGMEHKKLPIFSVQYHPEASPGPHEANYLFDRFIELIKKHKTLLSKK